MSNEVQVEINEGGLKEPWIEVKEPLTGLPILLRDPAYQIVEPKRTKIQVQSPGSFVAAVQALAASGKNRLVELRSTGTPAFVYRNELGPEAMMTIGYGLQVADTAQYLCLHANQVFGQRDLVKLVAQHPELFEPICDQPKAVLASIAQYEISEVKSVSAQAGGGTIALSVGKERKAVNVEIPELWKAKSELYVGHETQEVTLYCEQEQPEPEKDGGVKGRVTFTFSLWAPAAVEVETKAIEQARLAMAKTLGEEYTIIVGRIE